MALRSLSERYAGTVLYDGPLATDPDFQWMHHSRPEGLAIPCRLPECRALVMLTAEQNRRAYFCHPDHATVALQRRQALDDRLKEVEMELSQLPTNADGLHTTRRGRALFKDLEILRKVRESYASPND